MNLLRMSISPKSCKASSLTTATLTLTSCGCKHACFALRALPCDPTLHRLSDRLADFMVLKASSFKYERNDDIIRYLKTVPVLSEYGTLAAKLHGAGVVCGCRLSHVC